MQRKNVDSDNSLLIDTNRKGLLEKSSLSLLDKVIWNLRFVLFQFYTLYTSCQNIALCLITGKIFFINAFFELKFHSISLAIYLVIWMIQYSIRTHLNHVCFIISVFTFLSLDICLRDSSVTDQVANLRTFTSYSSFLTRKWKTKIHTLFMCGFEYMDC